MKKKPSAPEKKDPDQIFPLALLAFVAIAFFFGGGGGRKNAEEI